MLEKLKYHWDDYGPIYLIMGGLIACIIGLAWSMAYAHKRECEIVQQVTGKKTHWDIWAGCFVQHDGEIIPYDRWKMLDLNVKQRQ